MESLPRWVTRYSILIVIGVIILALAGMYVLGFRVGPGITLSRVGTLTLTDLPANVTVFIDQSSRTANDKAGSKSYDLTPGSHMLIVSESNAFPWSKLVTITSGENVSIKPLFIPMNVKATPIMGDARTQTLATIASSTLPASSTPLILENGCAHVYVSNNQIVADPTNAAGCMTPSYMCAGDSCGSTIVYSPIAPLTTVLPYPGHQDALIVGFKNTLYALSLDPRSPQFFAPILEGAIPPSAAVTGTSTLLVKEGTGVFSVSL